MATDHSTPTSDRAYEHLYVLLEDYNLSSAKARVIKKISQEEDFSSAIDSVVSLVRSSQEDSDEIDFYPDLFTFLDEVEEVSDGQVVAFTEPYWEKFSLISDEGEQTRYALPLALVVSGDSLLLHLVLSTEKLRFPVYSDLNSVPHSEAVFVPLPDDEPVDEKVGVWIGEDIYISQISETDEGIPVYGYYPWSVHPLPTFIALFCNTNGISGPVFLILPPPEDGDFGRSLRRVLGSETLGLMMLTTFAQVVSGDEEEEEEEEGGLTGE